MRRHPYVRGSVMPSKLLEADELDKIDVLEEQEQPRESRVARTR